MKSPARLAFRDGASHKGKEKRNDMTLRKRQGNPTYRICQLQPQDFTNPLLEGVPLERMLKPHPWNSRVRSRSRALPSQATPAFFPGWGRFFWPLADRSRPLPADGYWPLSILTISDWSLLIFAVVPFGLIVRRNCGA
jgi:hypothetical protein